MLARRASTIASNGLAALGRPSAAAIRFRNTSPFTGAVELFHRPALHVAGQADVPMPTDADEPTVPDGLDVAAVGVRATFTVSGTAVAHALEFAVATHAPVTLPVPEQTQIFVDTDRDGNADWRIRAGDHRGPDNVQTFVARWDAAAAAITGTERITDTFFSSDVATHASVLSVPTILLDMPEPKEFDFWVIRRGTHEDWSHLGVPDVVPDGAGSADGPRLTYDPAHQARVPVRYGGTVNGDSGLTLDVTVAPGSADPAKRDDGFLVLYPQNAFAVDAAADGGQFAWLVPGTVRLTPVYLPAVFALFDAGVMP